MTPFQADLSERIAASHAKHREIARSEGFVAVRQQVIELLLRRFGAELGNLKEVNYPISHWVLRAQRTGELPLSSEIKGTIDKNYKSFLDGVDATVRAGDAILAGMTATTSELAARGYTEHPDILSFQAETARLARFLTEAQAFQSHAGKARSSDPRSHWHGQARAFAGIIEAGFAQIGSPCPTRNSVESALVLAVTDLLNLSGMKVEDGTVRKALVGKSLSA